MVPLETRLCESIAGGMAVGETGTVDVTQFWLGDITE